MQISNHHQRLIWFAYLAALFLWSICSYFELGKYLATNFLFARVINGRPYVLDFVNVYNAAILAKECLSHPINIYDPLIQSQSVQQLIAPVKPELPFYLQYPPYFFSLMLPLSLMSMSFAWVFWFLLGAFLLFITVKNNLQNTNYSNVKKAFIYAGAFCAFPTWLSFELGQTSLLLLPLFSAYWLLLKNNKPFKAGLISSLMAIKLQYTPFILVIGIILGRLNFALGFALGLALLIILALVTVGPANVLAYPNALISGETGTKIIGVSPEDMQNLRGVISLIMGGDSPIGHYASIAFLAISIIVAGIIWLKNYQLVKTDNKLFEALAACTTLLLLVSSPHTHIQDYLLTLLPCLWLYNLFSNQKNKQNTVINIATILIVFYPFLSWVFYIFKDQIQLFYIQPFFVWALVLIMICYFVYLADFHDKSK
jgi:hypothetical protein